MREDILIEHLLEGNETIDSITLERAVFSRKLGIWKESERFFLERYNWNNSHQLVSKEDASSKHLYAYNNEGWLITCYHIDKADKIKSRENFERDENSRLIRRILTSSGSRDEQIWTYEYDNSGRIKTERCGNNIRVEKFDQDGLLVEEYLQNSNTSDMLTEYTYDSQKKILRVSTRESSGTVHRQTDYNWNANNRLESLSDKDFLNNVNIDEYYTYGAFHGAHWLERITWVPDGKRKNKKRPREVIYRSLAFEGLQVRSELMETRTIAFSNGVYHGSMAANQPEGSGVFQYNDESRYEGEFHNGSIDGPGKLTYADGRELEGSFTRGVLEGFGRCSWPDGSRYEGNFKGGKMDGIGVFHWADGARFEGLFKDGKRTDEGFWEG